MAIHSTRYRHAVAASILCLGLLGTASPALADVVYKCRSADGAISFQDSPCPQHALQAEVALAAAPPAVESPAYSKSAGRHAPAAASRRSSSSVARTRASEPMSYECRAATGEVFYRHGGCPASIANAPTVAAGTRRGAAKAPARVTALALPRSEACRRLRASSSGRSGRAHDDTVSTYDRNLGRDPCR